MSNPTVIVDIDGTLADISHRKHHVARKRKRWGKFFEAMDKDLPLPDVAARVRQLSQTHIIILVTGRPEEYRQQTTNWLEKYRIPYQQLYMRQSGDFRPDDVVKQEILSEQLNKDEIKLVIDDRPRVIRMWRENGLEVEDVGDGIDFNCSWRCDRAMRSNAATNSPVIATPPSARFPQRLHLSRSRFSG